MDAETPFLYPDIMDPKEMNKQQEMYKDVLRGEHIPQQRPEVTNQANMD